MLLSKKYDADDIISLKISNGDEIVAKFVSETDSAYVLSKPMAVVPSQQGIGLIQAMFSVDPAKELHLAKSHVMIHSHSADGLADHYREVTSGIQLVRKGSLVV